MLLCCVTGRREERVQWAVCVCTIKCYKYINYKWEHYTYVSYKQTGSQTSVVDLKCPHYNTDVQEVFFLLSLPLHNWLHVAQNSSFSHGGKNIKWNKNCMFASCNSGATDNIVNLKPTVGTLLFGDQSLPAPEPGCPGSISRGSACSTVMEREASVSITAHPGWAATLGGRHSSSCLWQWPVPSLYLFQQRLQWSTQQRNRKTACLSLQLTAFLPSPLTNTKKASVWEQHPTVSASDPPLFFLLRPYV